MGSASGDFDGWDETSRRELLFVNAYNRTEFPMWYKGLTGERLLGRVISPQTEQLCAADIAETATYSAFASNPASLCSSHLERIAIKVRKAQGSEMMKAILGRGLEVQGDMIRYPLRLM